MLSIYKIDAVETFLSAAYTVAIVHRREHIEREHHVLQHRERVEESRRLEYHAHLAAHQHLFMLRHSHEVTVVVEHFAACRREQTHEILHQNRLTGSALSDDEVGLAVLEDGVNVLEDFLVPERLA